MASKIKLLVDSYDQRQPDANGNISRDSDTIHRSRGELFEPTSKAEKDRLAEIGAALDPKEAQEREAEDLRRRQADLERQAEALAAELDQVEEQADRVESGKPEDPADDLESQTKADLVPRATAAGVENADSLRKAELIDAIRSAES